MTRNRIILGLILLTVVVFCLVAARKLTTTPKFDGVSVGMSVREVYTALGPGGHWVGLVPLDAQDNKSREFEYIYACKEGAVTVRFVDQEEVPGSPNRNRRAIGKSITRRGPLERLFWEAGWRPRPAPATCFAAPAGTTSI